MTFFVFWRGEPLGLGKSNPLEEGEKKKGAKNG